MKLLTAVALLTLVALPKSANAATITFDTCTGAPVAFCGAGTMSTQLVGNTIQVTVAAPGFGVGGTGSVFLGYQLAVGFNVEGNTSFSVSGVTSGYTFSTLGAAAMGTYGVFEGIIADCNIPFACSQNPVSPIQFNVSRTGGFTADTQLFVSNSNSFLAAALIRQLPNGPQHFVGASVVGNTPVPEPGTMILLGTGLLAAARARKRFAAKK